MTRLFCRVTILATPLMALMVAYVALDPFQVIRAEIDPSILHGVAPNREMLNTELLLQGPKPVPFDAFIFGNSRSLAFHCRDWLEWIAPATPFHYDALGDTLLGLRGKIRLLAREHIQLRQALLVIDSSLLAQTTDSTSVTTIKYPAVSGGSRLRFQAIFLKAFVSDLFAIKYLDYRLFGTYRPYMAGAINASPPAANVRDPATNDVYFVGQEEEIAEQPERYFANLGAGVDRTPRDGRAVIKARQLAMLQDIRAAFEREGTDYQIVVSPDFAHVRLHPSDVAILRDVFGADRVHDFSRDPSLGLDVRDWYDTSHYRPLVAQEMLRRVYGP